MQTATAPDPELLAALRPWTDRARSIVARRLTDARAHAALGSLSTATARLGELSQQLVDHIGDARAHFYRAAYPRHRRDGLDPAIHDMSAAPTPEGETAVRRVEVLGRRAARPADVAGPRRTLELANCDSRGGKNDSREAGIPIRYEDSAGAAG
jgi:hypothetical protein